MDGKQSTAAMQAIVQEYFRKVDEGAADLHTLFASDALIYYPKFGLGRGSAAMAELGGGIMRLIREMQHPLETMTFHPSGSTMIVEGVTRGSDRQGRRWSGGETPGGRFCNVFDIRDGLIQRMFIYLDPDRLGDDGDRFLWGTEGRAW